MKSISTDPLAKSDRVVSPAAIAPAESPKQTPRTRSVRVSVRLAPVAALVLGTLFIFLTFDFRAVQGNFTAQRQVETYTSSVDATHPLPLDAGLALYVLRNGILAGDLGDALAPPLSSSRYVGEVLVRQEPVQPTTKAILVVEVGSRRFGGRRSTAARI